jgi:hypothetical protein
VIDIQEQSVDDSQKILDGRDECGQQQGIQEEGAYAGGVLVHIPAGVPLCHPPVQPENGHANQDER